MSSDILFEVNNETGIIRLNKLNILNALDINLAEKLTLKDCLKIEYQVNQHVVYRKDFKEGVDNVLVSKAFNPKWNPSKISDIDFEEVKNFFVPHVEPLNI